VLITPDGILNGGGRLFFDWTNITSRYEQRLRETAMMADNHGHLALKQNYRHVPYTLLNIFLPCGNFFSPSASRRSCSSDLRALHRQARKTRLFNALGGPPKYGLTYSQSISPPAVTSNIRPKSPSQISVLPFGNRCACEILGLKKSLRADCYVHVASFVNGLVVASMLAALPRAARS
jgi:hypothetical protein